MYLFKRSFWSITRIIRLLVGIVAMGEAINSGKLVFYIIGLVLLAQSLLVQKDCSYYCVEEPYSSNKISEIESEEIK